MLAYFDCFSGVAGDMVLGAMVDAGLPFSHLRRELARLPLKGYELAKKMERRGVVGGTNVMVRVKPAADRVKHISYREINKLISSSRLNNNVKKLSLKIFEILGKAEARVHRKTIAGVHFHEVGAIDSIVDIVGAAIGFDYFKFSAVYSSPLPVTRGWITCEHGRFPVPAPATLEILKGIPLVPAPVKAEIVTPTGASILKAVVCGFGESPIRIIKKIGYGHGDRHFDGISNSLRLIIGEGKQLILIETNIDDMNPQFYDYVIDELMRQGAIDVVVNPALMKKRRPAAQIQVLCDEDKRDILIKTLLKETTSIGVRFYPVSRKILGREIRAVKTRFGTIHIKISSLDGEVFTKNPEYEDLKKAARKYKVPLKEVFLTAMKHS